MRATSEERALARAAVFRLLALAFSYPTDSVVGEFRRSADVAEVGGRLIDPAVAGALAKVREELGPITPTELEHHYQRIFTLSYSEECPLYETAFSARHLFQQTQQQADIAGFYRAFGVEGHGERPDHLATELEFAYLLALKEAKSRRDGHREGWEVSRAAMRSFLRDHLGRWGHLVAQRVAVVGAGTAYAAAAHLLLAMLGWEQRYLRVGRITPFRDEPVLIADEPGDLTCPIVGAMVEQMAAAGGGDDGLGI